MLLHVAALRGELSAEGPGNQDQRAQISGILVLGSSLTVLHVNENDRMTSICLLGAVSVSEQLSATVLSIDLNDGNIARE